MPLKLILVSAFAATAFLANCAYAQSAAQSPAVWRIASSFDKRLVNFHGPAEAVSQALSDDSDVGAKTRLYLPGEIVPGLQVLDAVSKRIVDLGWTTSAYFAGRDPSLLLLSQPPFISADQFLQWRREPVTAQLADSVYAKLNVKAIPCGMVDGLSDFALKDPIDVSGSPLLNRKIAVSGHLQSIYLGAGILVQSMAPTELFPALNAGVIDGASLWGPSEMTAYRINERAKVLFHPSAIRPFSSLELLVNLDLWRSLPETRQKAIEKICIANLRQSLEASRVNQREATAKLRLDGVTIAPLPEQMISGGFAAWARYANGQQSNHSFAQLMASLPTGDVSRRLSAARGFEVDGLKSGQTIEEVTRFFSSSGAKLTPFIPPELPRELQNRIPPQHPGIASFNVDAGTRRIFLSFCNGQLFLYNTGQAGGVKEFIDLTAEFQYSRGKGQGRWHTSNPPQAAEFMGMNELSVHWIEGDLVTRLSITYTQKGASSTVTRSYFNRHACQGPAGTLSKAPAVDSRSLNS